MGLIDSWTATSSTTSTTRTFAAPRAQAAGSLLVLAVTLGSGSATVTITDARGNSYDEDLHIVHSGATFNETLAWARLDTAIQAGDLITVVSAASSNRCALVAGVFDDVLDPIQEVGTSSQSSSATVSIGPTASLDTPNALILMAVAGAGGVHPVTAGSGMTLVGSVATTVGSADRSAALLYKYESSHTHSASAGLPSGVISTAIIAALAAVPPDPGDPGPTFNAVWFDGTDAKTVTSLAWTPDGVTLLPINTLGIT